MPPNSPKNGTKLQGPPRHSTVHSFKDRWLSPSRLSGPGVYRSAYNFVSKRLPDKVYARMGAFSLVGIANTIAGVSVVIIAGLLGSGPILSNVFGNSTGLIMSFVLNSRFTFQDRVINRFTLLRFLCAFAIAFAVNIGTVYIVTSILTYSGLLASLSGAPLFTGIFYVLCEYWVFQRKKQGLPEKLA